LIRGLDREDVDERDEPGVLEMVVIVIAGLLLAREL